jgi:hypothetical protein
VGHLAYLLAATIVGRLVTRTGEVKLFPQLGLTLEALSFLLLAATVTIGSPRPARESRDRL